MRLSGKHFAKIIGGIAEKQTSLEKNKHIY